MRKGANGISVFKPIFFFEKNIISKLTIDPIQKDRVRAVSPSDIPSIQPIPKISLASPSPIHLPFDMNQIKAKGIQKSGPANICSRVAFTKSGPTPV